MKYTDKQLDTINKYCMNDDLKGLTIDRVILSDFNKKLLDEFLIEINNRDKFMKYGYEPVNRLLLYGASGTGKTFLTKCLAAELVYSLFAIDIANALSTGKAAEALSEIFEIANFTGNSIIFLDECDAIARDRTSSKLNEDASVRRANNALFQLLDRMNPTNIFISATNLYDELDVAFTRRFNVKMKFDRPTMNDISSAINKFKHKDFKIEEDFDKDIKQLLIEKAKSFTTLSYYEIEVWVTRATKLAIIEGSEVIKESTIFKFMMQAMRIKDCRDKDGKLYLINY